MIRPKLLWVIFLMLVLTGGLFSGCSDASKSTSLPQQPIELNVSAALGLKEALLEIQKSYEAQNPGVKIVYNLAAAGSLQKQIEQGVPADIFISASKHQIDALLNKNMIRPETYQNLVGNQLVLITSASAPLTITSFKELTLPEIKQVGMGAPETVPAGEYAKQVLNYLGVWDEVHEKTVLAKDVKTVLSYVETGNVDAGIVFSTVAITSDKVKIVASAPQGSHEEIIFPGAVLQNSPHPQAAEAFLRYLVSPAGMKVFEKYGFTPVN